MKLLLAGASGLVGNRLLAQASDRGHETVLVTRRALGSGHEEIITDFEPGLELPGADAAVCTLGTTIASAGSRAAFYAVDHDAVIAYATAARRAGVEHFLVITAVGANPRAAVYYSRVKGEVERDLDAIGFRCLDIAQPGLLLGSRGERRPVESFLQSIDPLARKFLLGPLDRYAGIAAEHVAKALLELCSDSTRSGVFRHGNRDLQALSVKLS
ncbi:MAG: oxidoreductase [Halieaceae bacterium]|jgi:uncharacterized protein YbjT (DUF2867 family)|nr:oxidoreductase [Halieaceae bacterium]